MSGMNRTKRNHRALAHPDRSRLRKMSMNTQTRIQIQITHRKTSKMVQNTLSNGYELLAIAIRDPSRAAMIDEVAITGVASVTPVWFGCQAPTSPVAGGYGGATVSLGRAGR